MVKVMKKSGLVGKLSGSLKAHAKDETVVRADFSSPPPGIVGGTAKLNYAKIGVYASGATKGEKFVRLAGTIVSPKTATVVRQTWRDGKVVNLPAEQVHVEGLNTSRMFPLCDTKAGDGTVTSADEHIAEMLNELRTLGGDECTEDVDSEESLAAALSALEGADVSFRFSTSAGKPTKEYPTPRTWENWRGACDSDDEEEEDEVMDDSAKEEEEDPAEGEEEEKEGEEAEKEEEEENWEPKKGEVYGYKPPKHKRAVECEVMAVLAKAKTVTLKNLEDGKTLYKGIAWDELEGEE